MMIRPCAVLLIVCSWLIVITKAGNVELKPCTKVGSDNSIVKAIRVEKCTAEPCKLKRDKNYKFEIDFVPKTGAKEVDIAAYGVIGIEILWPQMKTNACKEDFNVKCPLEAGKQVTYINNVHVLRTYPAAQIPVHWKIKLDGKLISCHSINVQLV